MQQITRIYVQLVVLDSKKWLFIHFCANAIVHRINRCENRIFEVELDFGDF